MTNRIDKSSPIAFRFNAMGMTTATKQIDKGPPYLQSMVDVYRIAWL